MLSRENAEDRSVSHFLLVNDNTLTSLITLERDLSSILSDNVSR